MMSGIIRQETAVFLISVLHGAALTLLYDLLRALRRNVRHGLAALSAEDFLFWLAAGFSTFCLVFRETEGAIRGYVCLGVFLGFWLYHITLSRPVTRMLSALFQILGLPWRLLSSAAGKTWRFFKKRIEFARKKVYNVKKRSVWSKQKRGRRNGRKKKTAKQK